MDKIAVNSNNVKKRLHHYLGLESQLIFPPCHVDEFEWLGIQNFYLSTARLESYKRVLDIVNAFTKMPDKNLIVASGGAQFTIIKNLAKEFDNIQVLGWVDTDKLKHLLAYCIATIYIPIVEDFGISPIESMASGKPVIGVEEGGLIETIRHGKTGVLINGEISFEQIKNAVSYISKEVSLSMKEDCIRQANYFSKDRFNSEFASFIELR